MLQPKANVYLNMYLCALEHNMFTTPLTIVPVLFSTIHEPVLGATHTSTSSCSLVRLLLCTRIVCRLKRRLLDYLRRLLLGCWYCHFFGSGVVVVVDTRPHGSGSGLICLWFHPKFPLCFERLTVMIRQIDFNA